MLWQKMELPIQVGNSMKPSGFAYIALLATLTILVMVLTAASESIAQNAKREREQQLFFVGEQFFNAIASYYEAASQAGNQYPQSFEQLLKDDRAINVQRHLRRIYRDPMTGSTQWGLVRNEQQRIIGVYSLSSDVLLKTDFDRNIVTIDSEQANLVYSDLKFIYLPKTTQNK